jgi:C4-type Zn-finger protein
MTLRQICCWLTGHQWMLEWETTRIPINWPVQRMKAMQCQRCGLRREVQTDSQEPR